MSQDLNAPQPPPQKGEAPSTHDLAITALQQRKAMGLAKYGTIHQHDNGRDHLKDAWQEAADLLVYLTGEIERRKHVESEAVKILRELVQAYPDKYTMGLVVDRALALILALPDVEDVP